MNEIGYHAPRIERAWTTRDLVARSLSLAMGMTACLLHAATSPLENALARHWSGDYVLAARVAFWVGTILGGLLGMAGMFLGVSLVARRVPTFGMAMLGLLAGLIALYVAAMTIARQ